MKRDPDQQAAILVSHNAVVSAGAGSGKTSVLTSR
ncbi:MAG: UvrD-helicase domain-containing protein, partial [Spirochaetota bacterium]